MRSKRHHYIPRCYLKGFTHNGKQLFIYDKQKDEIRPGNIDNSFTLWNRNTVTWPSGEKSDELENIYASIESDSAYIFPKVIASTPREEALTYMDKLNLSFFIAALLWRVPAADEKTKVILEDEGFQDRGFHIKYPDGWSLEDKTKLEKLLLGYPAFQKFYPLMLSFEPFMKPNFSRFINNWKLYYHDPGRLITGDNLAIIRRASRPDSVLTEFILPLAPGRLLVSSRGKPAQTSNEWTIRIDLKIIEQAERYVCSNDITFLEMLVKLYKIQESTNQDNSLEEIFSVVD